MNYRVLITDEATDDVFNLVKYIQVDLCNPDAANKLYTNLNREVNNMGDFPLKFADSGIKYRGYIIHKKIYQSYLLFYIISDENQTVYVLRILKDIMNWRNILQKKNIYHFSNYRSDCRQRAPRNYVSRSLFLAIAKVFCLNKHISTGFMTFVVPIPSYILQASLNSCTQK